MSFCWEMKADTILTNNFAIAVPEEIYCVCIATKLLRSKISTNWPRNHVA
uniref:Uncharacterized protein n=1 Tax=Rhizophora mucronata TaxID=61149 RepID=A0A2P2NM26_RHIMU